MAKYRDRLPQLDGDMFLTDGGLETVLVFHKQIDLPHFAAFDLLRNEDGRKLLYDYYVDYAEIARANGLGFILESATWRASSDWGTKLGYTAEALTAANQESISMLSSLRARFETGDQPMVISGCLGPRGDGYDPGAIMSPDEAENYHAQQIQAFRESDADMVTAFTLTNIPEAIGMTRAAAKAGLPIALSFTVETDGCLPTGDTLRRAIEGVDAATDEAPAYYMINCAHPSHFDGAVACDEPWLDRIRGLRANASRRSHAELDESTELDEGNPRELGTEIRELRGSLRNLNVLGGCCGTDHRHVDAICSAWLAA